MSFDCKLFKGDCLDVLRQLAPQSVDVVICDMPYGTTACPWDSLLDLDQLWDAYDRIVKGAIVLTAAQPFTSRLVMSKPEWFRHEWIWDKVRPSGMLIAKYRPMMRHESICVFAKQKTNYAPVMESRATIDMDTPMPGLEDVAESTYEGDFSVSGTAVSASDNYNLKKFDGVARTYSEKYPQSILRVCKPTSPVHPTQKPVELMAYLIKTYSQPGDTVLDNCMGSGSTGIACFETDRKFIGIEKDSDIFALAQKRIEDAAASPPMASLW